MKALISMVFAVLLMVAPVKADMNPDEAVDVCAYLHDYSLDIMVDRQMGREFTWVMQKYGNCDWSEGAVRDAFHGYPRYLTQASREEAIRKFALESFVLCMQDLTGKDGK